MHNKTRKNCIKLIKTIEKCKKVVYYEAINKEETGRGTMNNKGGGIVDRRDHDRCRELYVKYRQFMYWYVKKHFPDLPEEDIRDILQEVWTSLLNAIDKLYDKGDEGQFAWLIRVTQTKVIDYYRSRKRTEELERDKGLSQYQIPEEWNGDFERIYQKECRKEHIKRRILAGACAAVILTISAVHIGTHLEFTSVAQADDIGKIHESEFEQGGYQYSLYGNVVEDESDAMTEDENEVYFNSDTLFDLNKELKETIKCPFFILNGVPDGYTLTEAVYGKLHRNISYRIQWESQYIYVSQQMQIDDVGNGSVNEETVVNTVYNDNLKEKIDIYDSPQDNAFNCIVVKDKMVLSIVSNLDLETFLDIVQEINYE